MVFRKKKASLQYKATSPTDGNPGGLEATPPPPGEAPVIPTPPSPSISEDQILGYGLIRLLREIQGLREEQLELYELLKEIKVLAE